VNTIAIIGAGFSGALTAVQLLRQARQPINIILINRSGLMARGIAYGTRTDRHVLNVPAARMSAFPDDEGDFERYAREQDSQWSGSSFVPRQVFGDYLETRLNEAARDAAPGVRFRAMVGDVERIEQSTPPFDPRPVRLVLQSGESIAVDRVVLALGNFAPADIPVDAASREFYSSPRYVRDPWRPEALWVVKPDAPVLLLGTGLTMLDILLSLRQRGYRGPVHAVSRRGLLPQAHRDSTVPPHYRSQLAQRLAGASTIREYLRETRREVAEAAAQGVDWRDIVGSLRAGTSNLWQRLSQAERQRFLRHVRPYWDVHRHRCAPQLGDALQQEIQLGTLVVHKGRLIGFEESPDGVTVRWRQRGAHSVESLRVGTVINCTGPVSDTRRCREPLIAHLRDCGQLSPDPLGLGLVVGDAYRLLTADGQPSNTLHYIGPLLRARDWEATAVPELRRHARQLAGTLLTELGASEQARNLRVASQV